MSGLTALDRMYKLVSTSVYLNKETIVDKKENLGIIKLTNKKDNSFLEFIVDEATNTFKYRTSWGDSPLNLPGSLIINTASIQELIRVFLVTLSQPKG